MYRDFDHIFKRAQQAGLKRGIVGDEQWLRFVHDSLATDGFDGTQIILILVEISRDNFQCPRRSQ